MTEQKHLPALALQMASACIIISFVLVTGGWENDGLYYPLVLLPYALLMYPVNRLFLRRERSMRGLVLLGGGCAAGLFVSIVLSGCWADWASLVFAGAFCVYPAVRACRSALEPVALRSSMLCMELSLVTLVLTAAWCGISEQPAVLCLPAVLGCAAAILGVMLSRMEGSLGARGWGLILLAFGLAFLLLWVLVRFAAAPAGQGVVALWQSAVGAVRFVLGLIWRLILFLISLIPQTEIEGYEMEHPTFALPEQQAMGEGNAYILGAMALVGLALLAVAVVRLLIRLGRIRIGGQVRAAAGKRSRNRPSLGQGLARLASALLARLRLCLRIRRERDTPAGMLCILVRRCRLGPWHKRAGETPREFLTRLRDDAQGDARLYAALDRLIPAVDAAVYGPASARTRVEDAAWIRRRIGSAVRRQSLMRAAGRIRARLSRA